MDNAVEQSCVGAVSATEQNLHVQMNFDCWEIIFGHLSPRNILSMGMTCEVMLHLAGRYIQQYLPDLEFEAKPHGIVFEDLDISVDFHPFITLIIERGRPHNIPAATNFDALQSLTLGAIYDLDVNLLQHMLKNVEILKMKFLPKIETLIHRRGS